MEISWHILLNILTLAIKIQMETLETKLRKQNLLDLRWGSMIISKFIDYRWCMRILERSIWTMKYVSLQVRSRKDNGMQIVNFPQNDRPDLSRRHSSSSIRNKRDVITDTNNSNDWIVIFWTILQKYINYIRLTIMFWSYEIRSDVFSINSNWHKDIT